MKNEGIKMCESLDHHFYSLQVTNDFALDKFSKKPYNSLFSLSGNTL